jgi:hypothetical protein
MKRGKVVSISKYRGALQGGSQSKDGAGQPKPLPDAGHLWELLDRNISIDVWKKGI